MRFFLLFEKRDTTQQVLFRCHLCIKETKTVVTPKVPLQALSCSGDHKTSKTLTTNLLRMISWCDVILTATKTIRPETKPFNQHSTQNDQEHRWWSCNYHSKFRNILDGISFSCAGFLCLFAKFLCHDNFW